MRTRSVIPSPLDPKIRFAFTDHPITVWAGAILLRRSWNGSWSMRNRRRSRPSELFPSCKRPLHMRLHNVQLRNPG